MTTNSLEIADELGINHAQSKKKTYDVDLDAFMNPDSGSILSPGSSRHGGDTTANVQQLIQAAKWVVFLLNEYAQV